MIYVPLKTESFGAGARENLIETKPTFVVQYGRPQSERNYKTSNGSLPLARILSHMHNSDKLGQANRHLFKICECGHSPNRIAPSKLHAQPMRHNSLAHILRVKSRSCRVFPLDFLMVAMACTTFFANATHMSSELKICGAYSPRFLDHLAIRCAHVV